jgi:hypothetical protein
MLPHPEFASLLLADGRLPVGGHTQSSGLEPALLGGLEHRDVPALVATRLRTVVLVDAATAVAASTRTTVRSRVATRAGTSRGSRPPSRAGSSPDDWVWPPTGSRPSANSIEANSGWGSTVWSSPQNSE